MTKAKMIERLQELEQFLNRDAKDVAEQFNAEHQLDGDGGDKEHPR